MTASKFHPATALVLAFIALAGSLRVFFNLNLDNDRNSEMAFYSPMGAMALFGGARFNKTWKAFLLPPDTLILSDRVLHQIVFGK